MKTRLPFVFIAITVALDAIGIGLILPVTPDLIRDLTGEGIDGAADWGGLLGFTYAILQVLCGPLVGNLSDSVGRRPVLVVSLIAMGLDYFLMAFAGSLWLLFLARAISGATGATYATAYAVVADLSSREERAANFGLVGAAFGVGFVLGPVIGGLLGELGPRAPFIAAGVLALMNAAFGWFVLPETMTTPRPFSLARANPLTSVARIARLPAISGLVLVFLIYCIGHNVYPVIWAYFTRAAFDWSSLMVGVSLGTFGICMAVVQGVLIRPILARLGPWRTTVVGFVLNIAVMLALPFLSAGWAVLALSPLMALGVMVTPALQGIMANRTRDDEQGELQGVIAAAQGLASILSPLLMTRVFDLFTGEGAPIALPGAPFLLAALLMVVSLLLLRGVGRDQTQDRQA